MHDDFIAEVYTLGLPRFQTYWELAMVSWNSVTDEFTVQTATEPINEDGEEPEWRTHNDDDYLYWVAVTIWSYNLNPSHFVQYGMASAGQILGTAIFAKKSKMILDDLLQAAMKNNWRGYIDFPKAEVSEEA
jgi:hypothetical protein